MGFIKQYPKTCIFLLLFFVILPYSTAKFLIPKAALGLTNKILSSSFGPQAKVDDIKFEPFGLVFEVDNVEIKENIFLRKLYINFDFPKFSSNEINISQFTISGISADFSAFEMEQKDGEEENAISKIQSEIKKQQKDFSDSWKYTINNFSILDSEIILQKDLKLKIENISFAKFNWPDFEKGAVDFNSIISLNDTKISLDGKLEKSSSIVNFDLNNLKLEELNIFLDHQNLELGTIAGIMSSKGKISQEELGMNIEFNLNLENFAFNSKKNQSNYYSKKIALEKFNFISKEDNSEIKLANFDIENLLITEFSDAKKAEENQGSNIKISNIIFTEDKLQKSSNNKINFASGGKIIIEKNIIDKKENTKISASEINLVEFNGLLNQYLEHEIKSGKLSLNSQKIIEDEKIKGDLNLNFVNLILEKEGSSKLIKAISNAKNNDDNLGIKFAILGNKTDSKFKISSILSNKGIKEIILKITAQIKKESQAKKVKKSNRRR